MANALPVYHFLCDLQNQNKKSLLKFDWGALRNGLTILPRVEIEGVIVSPITWQLYETDLKILLDPVKDIGRVSVVDPNVLSWRKQYNLPDLVLLIQNDNELLINFNDELCLNMFLSSAKKADGGPIYLTEFLFDNQNSFVKDINGQPYTNEIVAVLVKESIAESTDNNSIFFKRDISGIQRSYSLGSEWLYYKFYCGINAADKILELIIKRIADKLISKGIIDKWFFIRYADPDFHIRVRFHLCNNKDVGLIISSVYKEFNKTEYSELTWKMQTDVYQPEVERYGIQTMTLSEEVFFWDSVAVVKLIEFLNNNADLRWISAIKSIDFLLNDFNFSIEKKLTLMDNLRNVYSKQLGGKSNAKEQLNNKYRGIKPVISDVLNYESTDDVLINDLHSILHERSIGLKPIADRILLLKNNDQSYPSIEELLNSYIHMALNRILKSKHNLSELVIYDFMWRIYRSEIAKSSKMQNSLVK
jgi:thiopeptide-type bacteriocin biosynthesis protein